MKKRRLKSTISVRQFSSLSIIKMRKIKTLLLLAIFATLALQQTFQEASQIKGFSPIVISGQKPDPHCEDPFIFDKQTCSCMCEPSLLKCQAPRLHVSEDCECTCPPTFCPIAQKFNEKTCQCEKLCLLQCNIFQKPDYEKCECVNEIPVTYCDLLKCPSDYFKVGCKCIRKIEICPSESCKIGTEKDDVKCFCDTNCLPEVCDDQKIWSPFPACKCLCPEKDKENCPAWKVFDQENCCHCEKVDKCGVDEYWNDEHCSCLSCKEPQECFLPNHKWSVKECGCVLA